MDTATLTTRLGQTIAEIAEHLQGCRVCSRVGEPGSSAYWCTIGQRWMDRRVQIQGELGAQG